jgi:SNF2 family DNA or RNA helicase
MKDINSGTIIKSHLWPEPVILEIVEDQGELIRIVGSTVRGKQHIDSLVTREQFKEIFTSQSLVPLSGDPEEVFLAIETMRYRFASLYDPLLAMNTSKVNPLPHQIEAVYGHILQLPKIRFLIADDPGAGKTIMAGLIIKELKLRHLVKRILILGPGHLKDQWYRELTEKFKEKFAIIDRGYFDLFPGENVWLRENQVITSIDFAKRDEILPSLEATQFDLVIVDEAHKMSAYKYGDKTTKTSRYRLGEILSRITEHFLFLTATPHKGDKENYRLFLDLLEPGFFASTEMLEESIQNKDNPLFIRRIKEDLKDFDGTPLFLKRYVETIAFELRIDSPKEKELYNELSKYVIHQYGKALKKNRNIAFALTILQRRLASSTFALLQSLNRRKKRLEGLLNDATSGKLKSDNQYGFDFDTAEDMNEEDRWRQEEIWETLSVAENRDELKKEIDTLDSLIQMAKDIINREVELKLTNLRDSLSKLMDKYSNSNDKKILIFTESRDTLEYLEKKIKAWGYKTVTIHGGMKLPDRINAEFVFKHEADVLIATEAAGEGINLQFCHLMVNYDIPWNPNRLEQRMGRIHRYGQQKEVFIFNLVARDTREGEVLDKLFKKLEEIRKAMGSDKVFDVLSEVLFNRNLSQLLMDAAARARSMEEILKEIDITIDEDYISEVKEHLGESLATHIIDYTHIKEIANQAREHRLIPEYTEAFFKKSFNKLGGRFKVRQDGFLSIESIPYEIKKISENDIFRKTYGELQKKYPMATFDKELAFRNPNVEFISFGHPIFEAVMEYVDRNFSDTVYNGAVFTDPDGLMDGFVLFYEAEINDGSGKVAGKRLLSFYLHDDTVTAIPPSIIWDLDPKGKDMSPIDTEDLKEHVKKSAISEIRKYKEELLERRNHQATIKEKYGIRSLEQLILKLDGDLINLYHRRDAGQNVDLVIRNKEERKKQYENSLEELTARIAREKNLVMGMPRFVGIIRIIPTSAVGEAMRSNERIEQIGMETGIAFERANNREPDDVADQNLGFDIRSIDKEGNIRYIEVKARADVGAVALTQNEWFKANRLGDDYYLYVVLKAASKPELHIFNNPAKNLHPDQVIDVVRYVIPYEQLKSIDEGAVFPNEKR